MNNEASVKLLWGIFLKDIRSYIPRLFHPKFVFIAITTLLISTCGIWIGPFFLCDYSQIAFSLFAFIITTLGILAAEHFFSENTKNDDVSVQERYMRKTRFSFLVFLWVIAFSLSFQGLKNVQSCSLWMAFFITMMLWLGVTAQKTDYSLPATPDKTIHDSVINSHDKTEPGGGL